MVRIAHIITGLDTGGAETMLYKLLRSMNRSRFDPMVVSLVDHRYSKFPIAELGIPVSSCGMRPGVPNVRGTLAAARELRRFQPHLLQGWMYHGNLAAQAAAAVLPEKTSVIWNIRGAHHVLREEKLLTAAAIWTGARLSALPSRIVSNSAVSAMLHQRQLGFSGDRWIVIPNGFELDKFGPSENARAEVRAELGLPQDTLLIGLIGRYHPMKDHANFLRAAAILRQTVPGAQFLLVGCGVDHAAALQEQAAALGLLDCAHLLGERADMPRIAAALDIATSSSYSEAFPNIIGEAMSCGVPCVVTDVGDSAWLVGDTGAHVPARDSHALAGAWMELCGRGPAGRRNLGEAARNRIAAHFSIASVAAQYEQMYEQEHELNSKQKGYRQCAA